jgi:hypothetical protein
MKGKRKPVNSKSGIRKKNKKQSDRKPKNDRRRGYFGNHFLVHRIKITKVHRFTEFQSVTSVHD